MRFATVQTDELADRCCAGQGWGRHPRAKPERDPRPERTPSAEPDPEHRHDESTRSIESSLLPYKCLTQHWDVTVCVGRARPNLIGEEKINGEEEEPDAKGSSSCSVAQPLQEPRVGFDSYATVCVWVPS